MTAAGALVLLLAAALGYGGAVLWVLGILHRLGPVERYPWAFAIGFGAIGWLAFFIGLAGWLSTPVLIGLCVLSIPAVWLLGRPALTGSLDRWGWLIAAVLAGVLGLDLVEALAPPSDADTLAYHFTNAKQFLTAGRIEFIPRPLDGAIPMLVQLTYMPALAIGGEQGLTLWTMVSGWAGAALLFAVCRRHIDANWSAAIVLVYLTVPAMIYGGGAGQVEPRLALFALAGAVATATAWRTGDVRFAILAGLAAGFFAGGKPFGLLFVAVCGMVLVLQRRWLIHGAAFGAAALLAGSQWYAFLWWHTGDPVFPMLFAALDLPDLPFWTHEFQSYFAEITFSKETPVPQDVWGLVSYPFIATMGGPAVIESARAGFGAFPLLALPFAVAGAWRFRHRIAGSDLTLVALIVAAYYVVWWFGTPSQRVRFLLPMLPALLVCLAVPAVRWSTGASTLSRPLAAVFVLCIGIQGAAAGLFASNALGYLVRGESRDAYLTRTVGRYPVAAWLNGALRPGERVLHSIRQFNYLLTVPDFFANTTAQMVVDLRLEPADPHRFWRQLGAQKITHIVRQRGGEDPLLTLGDALIDAQCARPVRVFSDLPVVGSRSLPSESGGRVSMDVLELTPDGCAYKR